MAEFEDADDQKEVDLGSVKTIHDDTLNTTKVVLPDEIIFAVGIIRPNSVSVIILKKKNLKIL